MMMLRQLQEGHWINAAANAEFVEINCSCGWSILTGVAGLQPTRVIFELLEEHKAGIES